MKPIGALAAVVLTLLGPMSSTVTAQAADTTRADTTQTERPRAFFTLQDAAIAGGFVVGTIGLSELDARLAKTFQDSTLQNSTPIKDGAAFFRWMGQPGPEIIGVTLYVVGRVVHNRPVAALGLHGLEALLLTAGFTGVIKGAAGRARPYVHADTVTADFQFLRGFKNGRDYQSFPSGHTATAFAVAASTTAEAIHWVGVKKWSPAWKYVAGGVLFGGATLVGVSRMYHDDHWASDVVGGAAIGTFSGFKVVKYAYRHPNNRIDRWLLPKSVLPLRNGGVAMSWEIPTGAASAR